MITRKYFEDKLKSFRKELIAEIRELFLLKFEYCSQWDNDSDENCIEFCNIFSGCYESAEIDHIYIGKTEISIYPKGNDFSAEHLSHIMNIHSLMLLHYIAKKEIRRKEFKPNK